MSRIPYTYKGSFWSKTFETINKDIDSNRYSFDNTAFPVLSFKVMIEDGIVTTNLSKDSVEVRFGQTILPFKNVELLGKVFNSFDISMNSEEYLDNTSIKGHVPQLLKEGVSLESFFKKYKYSSKDTSIITLPKDFLKYEVGINKIKQPMSVKGELSKFEYFEVDKTLKIVDDDCFTWIKIEDNKLENISEVFEASSTLLLDTKCQIDTDVLRKWIDSFFRDIQVLKNVLSTLDTDVLEISVLLYPPVITSMQLIDKPSIISPASILSSRIIEEVSFNVSASLVENSQKMFEIIFQDNKDDSLIFKDNSIDSSDNFSIIGRRVNSKPFKFQLENSVFEDLSGTHYPTDSFKVIYKIPKDIQAFLSNNLKYKITVRITDLTSER